MLLVSRRMLFTIGSSTHGKTTLRRVCRGDPLLSEHIKFVQKGSLQFDKMIDLFYHWEFRLRVCNLRDLINLNKVSQSRKLDGLHFFLSESILLLVDLLEFTLFLRGEFAKLVNQKALLSHTLSFLKQSNIYLFLLVLNEYLVNIDVKTHELGETLLTHKSLSLQVALLDRFSRQHTWPICVSYLVSLLSYFSILVHLPIPNFIKASLRQWTSYWLHPGERE